MNKKLCEAALAALKADGFPTRPGYCQMWVRLVVESVYGKQFEALIHEPSAGAAGWRFKEDGEFVVPLERGSVPGDLLYKLTGSGGYGHVGIRVPGNLVAENSSVHITDGRDRDARGCRTLREYGDFDVIVRLPSKRARR